MRPSQQSQTLSFMSLPDNLKIMIFQYLPIEDCCSLSLSNKQNNSLIKENSSLWASHLFRNFVNPLLRENGFDNPLLFETQGVYHQALNLQTMIEPRTLVIDHYRLKQLWKVFLEGQIPSDQTKDFVKRIFSKLSVPAPPFPSLKREIHTFPTKTMFQNFLTEVYFDVQTGDFRDRSRGLVQRVNKPEKFYELVCLLIRNYCKIVWSYLSSIKEPSILLQEYSRLWKDFVMLIIDYNQIFEPVNYCQVNASTQGAINNPIWRMMLEVWNDKVFSCIDGSLVDAFCFVLNYYRSQRNELKFDDTALYEKYQAQQSNFFYHFNGENFQYLQKILQDFYQSMSDLSLNEHTVFFWDCTPTYSDTPKGKLDAHIIEDSRILYNTCALVKILSPDVIKNQFEEDANMIEILFGNELHQKVIETQLEFLKDSLSSIFADAFNAAKSSPSPNRTSQENIFNLQKVYDILNIPSETKSDYNPEFSFGIKNILLDNLPSFYDYLTLADNLKEVLDYQINQNERKIKKLLKAGFILYTEQSCIYEQLRGKINEDNMEIEDLPNPKHVKEVPQI